MAAQKFDFARSSCGNSVCEQGATFARQLLWEKETSPDVWTPVDLTGYTAKMEVRKDIGTAVIITLSTSNSRVTLGGVVGTIDLLISASDTNSLPIGAYKYDLELTSPSGFVTRFIEGRFEVVGQITQ